MRLYHSMSSFENARSNGSRAVAIGVFDGLHIGHQTIIGETVGLAKNADCRAAVLTFEPMPRERFLPDDPPARLTRFRERFELIESFGIDELFCPRFDAVRQLDADEFVKRLLVDSLSARFVIVGDDFRYGARRAAGGSELRAAGSELGFDVVVVPPVLWRGTRVSSTAIRERLQAGDLAAARGMLGRDYAITGRVVAGLGLGRDFGFPTANVHLSRRLAPVDGIFAVRVSGLDTEMLDGVASIGTRPTIGGSDPVLEVYLFDFDRTIYGRQITVHFIDRLREERKFDSIDELKQQMRMDAEAARAVLGA
jgi:riboflavin kinase/FMN adenylyltransferase